MKILVCISHVPDTTTKIAFTNNNTEFVTSGVQFVINPYDEIALSKAIELVTDHSGTVTVFHVGDASSEPNIRKTLAMGADEAVRVNALPRDAWFVAHQIAAFARDQQFDLILTGSESIDYNGGQVAAFTGELLDIPSVSIVKKLTLDGSGALVERETEGGKEILRVPLPFVAGTAEGVAEPRIPNMRGIMSARTKPLTIIDAVEVPVLSGIVRYETPPPRGSVTLVDAAEPEKLVELLRNQARVL